MGVLLLLLQSHVTKRVRHIFQGVKFSSSIISFFKGWCCLVCIAVMLRTGENVGALVTSPPRRQQGLHQVETLSQSNRFNDYL